MIPQDVIPYPLLFNPLKHHLGYIRGFIEKSTENLDLSGENEIIKELKHIGGSVMDVYSGSLSTIEVCDEFLSFLKTNKVGPKGKFTSWTGTGDKDFRTIPLSDGSQWMVKYYNHNERYVHFFPARQSPLTFRIKANTLKSAVLYQIFIGKDYVTEDDLNVARAMAGLSPVKEIFDTAAITEMIELLRG
jgi:hypothetical protein